MGQIKAAKERIRQIANRLGWTPREAQAALGAANIRRKGKKPESYEHYFEQYRKEIHALLAADIGREGRGIQAARRIRARIGERRSTAAGLIREAAEEEALALGVKAGEPGIGEQRAAGRGAFRSAAAQREADALKPAFGKLGVRWAPTQFALRDSKGNPVETAARVIFRPEGNFEIEFSLEKLDRAEQASLGRLEPGTITRTVFGEEIIHAAHVAALKKDWIAKGKPGTSTNFQKESNAGVYVDLWNTIEGSSPIQRRKLRLAVMAAYDAYNELITSWTGIESVAASGPQPADPQGLLF